MEGIWSLLRCGPMANTAFTDPDHLARTLRRGLAHIQRHPELIDGCLTETGLTLASDPRSQSEKVSNGLRQRHDRLFSGYFNLIVAD